MTGLALMAAGHAEAGQSPRTATVPAFEMSVTIKTDVPAVEVDGQVTVPARNRPIDTLELEVDRRIQAFDVSLVSPAGSAAAASVARQRDAAVITLGVPVPAGTPVVVRFQYRIAANSSRSFHVAGDAVLVSGETSAWYPKPSGFRRATGRIRFVLPAGVAIAATGRRLDGRGADGAVQFAIDDPTTFSFAAGGHHVYTSPGEPAIALHLLKPRSRAGERLAFARRILDALVDEFGRYPHPDLEIVEMPDAAMGGSGNGTSLEGFVVVSSDVVERASLLTLAHEISHQWWADSVFAVGQSPMLLADTMCNYGALRALEKIYGEPAAAMARWRGFPGESLFAGGRGYLSGARAGVNDVLTSASVDGLVGGTKGYLVHDLLSRTLGRERFKTVLRDFTRDHAFQDTSWPTFVAAVTAAEPSIGWFFEQWYARPGVPVWAVTWNQADGDIRGVITQSSPYFRADAEVVMQGVSGQRALQVLRIDGPRTEFTWRPGFQVGSVVVDPEYRVPHDSPDRTADVDAIAAFGVGLKSARDGGSFNEAAIAALRDGTPESRPARDLLREVLLGDAAFERGDWNAARLHFDAALALAPWPEMLPGIHYSQAVLARRRADRALTERSARAAIDADRKLLVPTGWSIAARELLDEDQR